MKIRFENKKLNNSTRKNGMEISYGAGKRIFPKIRWMIIVSLVSAPVLLFLLVIGWGLLFVEVDGYVHSPVSEVFALEEGYVDTVYLSAGSEADSGTIILDIVPSYTIRQEFYAAAPVGSGNKEKTDALQNYDRRIVVAQREANRLRQQMENLQQLLQRSAATTAEVEVARRAYLGAMATVDALRSERLRAAQTTKLPDAITGASVSVSRQYRFPWEGKILKVNVSRGQLVKQHTPLVTIKRLPEDFSIILLVDTRFLRFVVPGKIVVVHYPDATKGNAQIKELGTIVESQAAISTGVFSVPQKKVPVVLTPLYPLTGNQRIIGVPVKVRFPRWEIPF